MQPEVHKDTWTQLKGRRLSIIDSVMDKKNTMIRDTRTLKADFSFDHQGQASYFQVIMKTK